MIEGEGRGEEGDGEEGDGGQGQERGADAGDVHGSEGAGSHAGEAGGGGRRRRDASTERQISAVKTLNHGLFPVLLSY